MVSVYRGYPPPAHTHMHTRLRPGQVVFNHFLSDEANARWGKAALKISSSLPSCVSPVFPGGVGAGVDGVPQLQPRILGLLVQLLPQQNVVLRLKKGGSREKEGEGR